MIHMSEGVKIPGLAQTFFIVFEDNQNVLILTLPSKDPIRKNLPPKTIAKVVLAESTEDGIRDAVIDCLRKGDIIHQVPKNVRSGIITSLYKQGGFIEMHKGPKKDQFTTFKTEITEIVSEIKSSDEAFKREVKNKLDSIQQDTVSARIHLDKLQRLFVVITSPINNVSIKISEIQDTISKIDPIQEDLKQLQQMVNQFQQQFMDIAKQKKWIK